MKQSKLYKELGITLIIVIFLAAAFFLPGNITGFASFSIYPSEPAGSDEIPEQENFSLPVEQPRTSASDEQIGILPIYEEILTQENITEEFEILPENESFSTIDFGLMDWTNQSDGFSTVAAGAEILQAITTNGSDFWILEDNDDFIYHVDRNGNNITDGFSPFVCRLANHQDITTNGSDFWTVSTSYGFPQVGVICHYDKNGNNVTDGFGTNAFGSDLPYGITTNGSDFWISDYTDDFIYHVDRNGNNITDGFSTASIGSNNPWGITTNGSDFWIVDNAEDFIYHTDRYGNNLTDGFSALLCDSGAHYDVTTNTTTSAVMDLWVPAYSFGFVCHISTTTPPANTAPTMGNVSITPTTAYTNSTLNCSTYAYDTNLDAMSVNITWYNGTVAYESVLINAITNGSMVSDTLTAGIQYKLETWNCTAFANDGTINSATNSTTITISNLGPSVGNVTILPTTAYTNSTLNCTTYAYDIDLDTLSVNFSWYNSTTLYFSTKKTGVTNGSMVSDTLQACIQSANETWNCSVTPNDGTIGGLPQSNITITSNTIPIINSIYITSDDDTKNTTIVNLTGTFSVSDLDTNDGCFGEVNINEKDKSYGINIWDTILFNETKWYNNSIEVISLKNSTTVSHSNTTKGENWMFSARASDGNDWSDWANSSNFTILNSLPVVYLRTPANDTSSTTTSTNFIYNVTDKDGNEISNCTLWIENSTGLANAGNDIAVTIDQNETFTVILSYETINWSVECIDNSNAKTNSTKWVYTVNQLSPEAPGGQVSHPSPPAPPAPPPEPPPELAPPAPLEVPAISIEAPASYLGSWWCGIQQGLTPEEIKLLLDVFGYVPCWVKIEPLNVKVKPSCNGVEYNVGDLAKLGINFIANKPVLDISLDQETNNYCPWCYDKIKDYDEIEIDCGGSCKECIKEEIYTCGKIPFILLLTLALLLALVLIYSKKNNKDYIKISVYILSLVLAITFLCYLLEVCFNQYLVFLYSVGIAFASYLIYSLIKELYKIKFPTFVKLKRIPELEKKSLIARLKHLLRKTRKVEYKEKYKLKPKELEIPKLSNVLIEFDNLVKKVEQHIQKKEFKEANQDYGALLSIYENIIDKLTAEEQIDLYNTLENLYSHLLVANLKRNIKPMRPQKLRSYEFKVEKPKEIKLHEYKREVTEEDKVLDKVNSLLKENKLAGALETYSRYYKLKLPERKFRLELEKIKPTEKRKIEFKPAKEELSLEQKTLNKISELIKENKLKEAEEHYRQFFSLKLARFETKLDLENTPKLKRNLKICKKPKSTISFDEEFAKLIERIRKGKYEDAERKYRKLFGKK